MTKDCSSLCHEACMWVPFRCACFQTYLCIGWQRNLWRTLSYKAGPSGHSSAPRSTRLAVQQAVTQLGSLFRSNPQTLPHNSISMNSVLFSSVGQDRNILWGIFWIVCVAGNSLLLTHFLTNIKKKSPQCWGKTFIYVTVLTAILP